MRVWLLLETKRHMLIVTIHRKHKGFKPVAKTYRYDGLTTRSLSLPRLQLILSTMEA
jgi:hypothetical protein